MSDKPKQEPTKPGATPATPPAASTSAKTPNPPRRWGLDGDQVLERLQNRLVGARMLDGATLTGGLVGYTEYTITLKGADGLKVVNKGAMAWLEPGKAAPAASDQITGGLLAGTV